MEIQTVIGALMEHYPMGGEQTVSDYASEYGEPGYDGGPVLLGNYWCRCDHGPDREKEDTRAAAASAERGETVPPRYLHGVEYHYPRAFKLLEDAGAQLEWYDEWVVVDDKAYRTTADSYSWTPTAQWNDDMGDYMTPDDGVETWVEWAVNDATRCLMPRMFSDAELESLGFVERECGFEDGWYGVNDDPAQILAAIQERENVDVLFKLSGVGQFSVQWCVYVRAREITRREDVDWFHESPMVSSSDECEYCGDGWDDLGEHSHALYVTRDGAAARTADELASVFLHDVASLTTWVVPADAPDPDGGWLEADDAEVLQDLVTTAESALSDAGFYVEWDDGYVIGRVIENGRIDA